MVLIRPIKTTLVLRPEEDQYELSTVKSCPGDFTQHMLQDGEDHVQTQLSDDEETDDEMPDLLDVGKWWSEDEGACGESDEEQTDDEDTLMFPLRRPGFATPKIRISRTKWSPQWGQIVFFRAPDSGAVTKARVKGFSTDPAFDYLVDFPGAGEYNVQGEHVFRRHPTQRCQPSVPKMKYKLVPPVFEPKENQVATTTTQLEGRLPKIAIKKQRTVPANPPAKNAFLRYMRFHPEGYDSGLVGVGDVNFIHTTSLQEELLGKRAKSKALLHTQPQMTAPDTHRPQTDEKQRKGRRAWKLADIKFLATHYCNLRPKASWIGCKRSAVSSLCTQRTEMQVDPMPEAGLILIICGSPDT